MSKAGAWAQKAVALYASRAHIGAELEKRPAFKVEKNGNRWLAGEVDDRGNLLLPNNSVVLTPSQAVEFAQWILDTFITRDGNQP